MTPITDAAPTLPQHRLWAAGLALHIPAARFAGAAKVARDAGQGGPEATMKLSNDQGRPDLEGLAAAIARSPIVVERPAAALLPPGFEAVDVAILNWIASEAQRLRRSARALH